MLLHAANIYIMGDKRTSHNSNRDCNLNLGSFKDFYILTVHTWKCNSIKLIKCKI